MGLIKAEAQNSFTERRVELGRYNENVDWYACYRTLKLSGQAKKDANVGLSWVMIRGTISSRVVLFNVCASVRW